MVLLMKLLKKPNRVELHDLLNRGVHEVISREHLIKSLNSGKQLRIKFGIDPTSPDLHLGHSVALRKLRQFQDLGHQAVLIIGDFTGQIGDPTGRSVERKQLTSTEIKRNVKTYLAQAGKVLNLKQLEVHYNSEWMKKNALTTIMKLAAAGSIQQMLRRADFKKRIDEGSDVTLLESMYPLFQGYDSVQINADVELGGTDQKFNLLTGRRVQRHFGKPEQDVLMVPLLEGTDSKKKMSKSLGNYIGFIEEPNIMFIKVMEVADSLVNKYFLLCTDISEKEIKRIESDIRSSKLNPKDAKLRLAKEIVSIYHSKVIAARAEKEFNKVFARKGLPSKIPDFVVKSRNLSEILVEIKAASSKSDAWRLIKQGAVKVDSKVVKDPKHQILSGSILQVGKRHFIKVSYKK